jgi:Ca-activated chloride channel family protein
MYLKNINTDIVPTQGTAIGDAVAIATQSFSTDNKNSKALIIISDGEDNETGAEEAVKMAAESGVKVFTIGVGSEEGGPIPLANGDFKRDAEGNVVVTKTNQEALKNLAQLGKGKFYMLYSGNEIVDDILRELGRIESKQFEELIYTEFDSKFQICIAIALFFLIIEWLLIERRLAIWDFLKLKKK